MRGGALVGRTSEAFPISHAEPKTGLDAADVLHSVEVRARVSAGSELSMAVVGSEALR